VLVLAVVVFVRLALWHFPEQSFVWIVIRDATAGAAFLMAGALILVDVRYGSGNQLGQADFAWAGYVVVVVMAAMLVAAIGAAFGGWRTLVERLPRPDRL
jgi:hypothetical protein